MCGLLNSSDLEFLRLSLGHFEVIVLLLQRVAQLVDGVTSAGLDLLSCSLHFTQLAHQMRILCLQLTLVFAHLHQLRLQLVYCRVQLQSLRFLQPINTHHMLQFANNMYGKSMAPLIYNSTSPNFV